MIIECQTCHARFRLDESRIKGRGARVKCRKCGESIIVLKEEAAPPPAQTGDSFFDLGSAVRDSSGEGQGAPSPIGNLIPFPAPPRPEEPAAPERPSAPAETSPTLPQAPGAVKDDVDLAFDRFLSAGPQDSSPSAVEKEAPAGTERETSAERPPRTEQGLGALTLNLGPEEKLDLPPAAAMGPPPGESQASEFRGEGGFLINDSETLDFLQGKFPSPLSEPPGGVGDISLDISSTPVDEGNSFLRRPEAPAPPVLDLTPPPPREDRSSPIPMEHSIEGNATPEAEAVPATAVPPPPAQEPDIPSPAEPAARRESPAPEAAPPARSSAWPAVALVLAILLAAGGYLGLTASGRKTVEGVFPGISALWGGSPAGPQGPKYDLRNVIGYYDSGAASPRILVIKGQVANLSTVDKSGIRVNAALLDNTDAVLMQQAVYAGNVLSGETIRKGDRDAMLKTLGNRFGEGLSNMHVAPGKAIPFMVVFFDAPANIDSYKLEAKDSE